MSTMDRIGSRVPDSKAVLVAALPPLGLAVMLAALVLAGVPLGQFVVGGRSGFSRTLLSVGYLVPAFLALAIVGVSARAATSGLPRWGLSWVFTVLVMVSMALTILAEDRPALISPIVDAVIALAVLALLAGLAVVAARRGMTDALMSGIGFASAFVLANFSAVSVPPFRRVDLALLVLPAGLAFSGLLVWAWRSGARAGAMAVLATLAVGVGLMMVYARALPDQWALRGSVFAIRVVQVAAIGLLAPPLLAWLLGRARPMEMPADRTDL